MSKRDTIVVSIIVFIVAFCISACTPLLLPVKKQTANVIVSLRIPLRAPTAQGISTQRFVHPETEKVSVAITGDDMDSVTETKVLPSGEDEIEIKLSNIPVGKNRLVTLSLFNAGGELLAEGSSSIDVIESVVNTVAITAIPKKTTALALSETANVPENSGGKTFVYALTIAASGEYRITVSSSAIKPAVFDSTGHGLATTDIGDSIFTFGAQSVDVYYIALSVPPDVSDAIAISVASSIPADSPDATITLLDIPGVVAPVRGAIPVTSVIDTAQYTGTVSWSGSPSVFADSTVYTATITLTEKTGYTLTGVAANAFTVAGAMATNDANSGTVTAVFPPTLFGLFMISVPAGSFQRDSDPANISTITAAFRMSEKEITRAQFLAIMGTDSTLVAFSTPDTANPVQATSWYYAIAFCNKLSLAEGLSRVYDVPGFDDDASWVSLQYADIPTASNLTWDAATADWTKNGYRLPTEMEWIWAAMGATEGTTGYNKAFAGSTGSNELGDFAVFGYGTGETGETTTQGTQPVGSKAPNELGLYDMSGNVWEWNWDQWDATTDYPFGALSDYRGQGSGGRRVLHGGSWVDPYYYCTVGYRGNNAPYLADQSNIGFRVVRN